MKSKTFTPPRPQLWHEEISFLQDIVSQLPYPSTIVEIGTAQGGGLHLLAESRRDSVAITIHSFDPYPGKDVPNVCRFHENVFAHELFSMQGGQQWGQLCGNKVNFLIIDGSHTLQAVAEDYAVWRQWLSQPGMVLFHDYDPLQRNGVSHPGVKVFCDAAIDTFGTKAEKQHVGRYLLLRTPRGEEVSFNALKTAAKKWIGKALQDVSNVRSRFISQEISLEQILATHTRISIEKNASGNSDLNDAAIDFFLANEIASLHEVLITILSNPTHVLKWMEYLEMFLHARQWMCVWTENMIENPIFASIEKCSSIEELSCFCADITLFFGILESIFADSSHK